MAWNVVNFLALAVVLTFLAIVSVALRFWAHTKSGNRFGPDDALIIPALLGVIAMAVTEIIAESDEIQGTQLGGMAQHQRNLIGPHGPVFTEEMAEYEKANFILQILSVFSLGFSKASVLCFYRRVFYVYPRFLIMNNILMCVITAWAISFFFTMVFQCRDPSTIWTTFEYARVNCVQTSKFYYALASTGFITDLMILVSPVPIIYQLKMALETRIAAIGILLLGALLVALPIHLVRTVLTELGSKDEEEPEPEPRVEEESIRSFFSFELGQRARLEPAESSAATRKSVSQENVHGGYQD
ncbi:plasma membrane protein pth11-like protein [Stemphylium lycopersici]|nr:plasma membrane protein pth11-like protein [Stemphylium lycopersici]